MWVVNWVGAKCINQVLIKILALLVVYLVVFKSNYVSIHYSFVELVICQDFVFAKITHYINRAHIICFNGECNNLLLVRTISDNSNCQKKKHINITVDNKSVSIDEHIPLFVGGGHAKPFVYDDLSSFIVTSTLANFTTDGFKYADHLRLAEANEKYGDIPCIISNIPLYHLVHKLFKEDLREIGKLHGMFLSSDMTKIQMEKLYKNHNGDCCSQYVSVFVINCVQSHSVKSKEKCRRKLKHIRYDAMQETHLYTQQKIIKQENPPHFLLHHFLMICEKQ